MRFTRLRHWWSSSQGRIKIFREFERARRYVCSNTMTVLRVTFVGYFFAF